MFKLLCVLMCCGSIYLARHHPRSELGAWMCAGMLLILTLHWINYNRSVSRFTQDLAILAMTDGECEPCWVKLEN